MPNPKSNLSEVAILKKVNEGGIESLTPDELEYFAGMEEAKEVKKALADAAVLKVKAEVTGRKINASNFNGGYTSRVEGTDASGEYLTPAQRKENFKNQTAVSFVSGRSSGRNGVGVGKNGSLALRSPSKVAPAVIRGEEGKSDELEKLKSILVPAFAKIEGHLQSIQNTFKDEFKLDKKQDRKDDILEEKAAKKGREAELEKGGKSKPLQIAEKALKPAKGLFDIILDFVKNILLGGALIGLINIFQNWDKIKTKIINVVNGVIGFLNEILKFLLGVMNPVNALISGMNLGFSAIFGAVNTVLGWFKQDPLEPWKIDKIPAPQIPLIPVPPEPESAPVQKKVDGGEVAPNVTHNVTHINQFESGGMLDGIQSALGSMPSLSFSGMKGGGGVQNKGINLSNISAAGGGSVTPQSGVKISGMGPDTQLVAAQPGEIVMSKKAVQTYGANNLLSMNKEAGGTNKPKIGSILGAKVYGMQGGGSVSPFPEGSYKGQSGQVFGDQRSYGGHVGIDVTENAPYKRDPKRPIYAPVHSKVLSEEYQTSGYTSGLMLDHGDGLQSRYVHMIPMKRPGDEVKAGEQIGKLLPLGKAPTWNSTHLHFELYKGSKLLNPTSFYQGLVKGQYKPSSSRGTGDLDKFNAGEGAKISAQVSSTSSPGASSPPGPSTRKTNVKVVPMLPPSGSQNQGASSGASADQSRVDGFSAIDVNNLDLLPVRSLYNVVG